MEKWKLKAIAKIVIRAAIFAILFIVFALIMLVLLVDDINIKEIINSMKDPIVVLIYFAIIIFIPIAVVYLITNAIKKKNEVNSEDYYRDIERQYTPAIASFLVDYKIEGNESVLATILDLYLKKYLNICKKNQKLEIEVTNENTEKLYLHEKYIIDCMKQNELIEVMKFQDKVEEDCVDSELVNKKGLSPYWFKILKITFIISILLVIALSIFPNNIIKNAFGISIIINILILIILSAIRRYTRTTKGEEFALKFKRLKNFLKDYTLLSERDINYINISDRYLPFALALGVANKLENSYVEYNNLISKYIKS